MENRPDPTLRHSTIVVRSHGQGLDGTMSRRNHHLGPGAKVVGGQLHQGYSSMQPRRTGPVKLDSFTSVVGEQRQEEKAPFITKSTSTLMNAFEQTSTLSSTRPLTRKLWTAMNHSTEFPRSLSPRPTASRYSKLVYFDGRQHHMLDSGGVLPEEWTPPHLDGFDLLALKDLAAHETPGAARTHLIASRYRVVAPEVYSPFKTTGRPATSFATTTKSTRPQTTAVHPGKLLSDSISGDTLRRSVQLTTPPVHHRHDAWEGTGIYNYGDLKQTYPRQIGHKEYESSVGTMNNATAWSGNGFAETSSISHGHPSTLKPPVAHLRVTDA